MAVDISAAEFLKGKDIPDKGFIVIHGTEKVFFENVLKKFTQLYGNPTVVHGEELSIDDFLELLGSQTLFTKKKFVLIKQPEKFFSKLRKKDREKLLTYLRTKNISNLVVFFFEQDLKKKDWGKEPFKTLSEVAALKIHLKKLTDKQLASLIKKKFSISKIEVEESVINFLLENFSDSAQLKIELDKLILYASDKGKLTLEEVKNLTLGTSNYTIFDFQSAFFQKKVKESVTIYETLIQGLTSYEVATFTFQVESLLLNTANRLLLITELLGEGFVIESIFNELGIKYPFQKHQYKNWLSFWKTEELVQLINNMYRLELNLKLKFLPPEEEFKKFIITSL